MNSLEESRSLMQEEIDSEKILKNAENMGSFQHLLHWRKKLLHIV